MNKEILTLRNQIEENKQARDKLYCTLKESIARGLLPAGTRLTEEVLADFFQVSRTPIREALKKLEMDRLIDTNSTNGCFVHVLTVDECLDTLEVLDMLRNAACELLLGRIPRAFLMILEQNTRKGDTLTDPNQRYENNNEFHNILVKATGNSVLKNMSQQLAFKERIIANTVLPVDYVENYAEHHRLMVKAIVNNDKVALQNEIRHSKDRLDSYMRRIVTHFLEAIHEDDAKH